MLPTSVAHHISVINSLSTTPLTITPTTTCLFELLRHHYYYATHSLKEDINRITLHHESVQLPSSKLPHTTITIVPLNVLCPVFIPTAANVYILPSSKKIEIKCYSGSVLSMMFYFPAATTTNHHYCTTITNQPTTSHRHLYFSTALAFYNLCHYSVVCYTLSWVSYYLCFEARTFSISYWAFVGLTFPA